MRFRARALFFLFLLLFPGLPVWARPKVVIGSKFGAEPLILSEMMAQLLEARGIQVERKLSLGPTEICFPALRSGQIDLYVEYTGAGLEQILKEQLPGHQPLRDFLHLQQRFQEHYQLMWLPPFGFNNTYVLALPEILAERRQLTRMSQLGQHTDLRAGFDLQFLNKPNLYPQLSKYYGFSFEQVVATEHSLVYPALKQGKIDLIEAYSTDAELARLQLRPLQDDRGYFPLYHAAPLVRGALLKDIPELPEILRPLQFCLDESQMQQLNLRVLEGTSPAKTAADFLQGLGQTVKAARPVERPEQSWLPLVTQHLALTASAVVLATLVGVPLGIWSYSRPRWAEFLVGIASIVQTIPGIALLAFFIAVPGLGLGVRSAIAALFLYALLPILRNTITGLQQIDPLLREAALGLGMRPREMLLWVELPLAVPTLMAGLRTCAVITVGSATLAAFVGGGGLGVPIVTGLQLNDTRLVLSGAIPSAALAVLVDQLLARVEARLSRVAAG